MTSVQISPPLQQTCRGEVLRDRVAEWESCERALATLGVRLPLPHRAIWRLARRGSEPLFLALRTSDGRCAGGFGIHAAPSRAFPGFRVLRIERFGEAVPRTLWATAVDALTQVARQEPRVLRLTVEVFSRAAQTRAGIAELLQQAGFVRAATTRNWGTTFALDLQPSEDELFGSFSPTVRRAIRSVAKLPVQVRSIDDRRSASRLDALSSEAFARTGARYQEVWDWEGVIELSRRAPDASRLVGLFRTDREGPEALLGFVWGWWNGESVSYFAGASSRPSDLQGVGIVHPLFWDLIVWAKGTGATWFDLGGATAGTAGSGDPLGGISEFKRRFSTQTVDVAEDWVLEPHAVPARVAALVSTGAAWLRRVTRR